jgi:hypothetical protein
MRRDARALRCLPLRLKVALHPRDVIADFVVACVGAHCSEKYHVLRTVGDDLVEGLYPQQSCGKAANRRNR